MKFIKSYEIDVIRLRDGRHTFNFEAGDSFFSYYQAEDWLNGADLQIDVDLTKTVSVMEVDFRIHGTINLTCDRSLEAFDEPLDLHQKVVYKYGPVEEEMSEEVFMITKDTPSINIAQLIYEFILLAIPAKKIHPNYRDEDIDEDDENFASNDSWVEDKGEDNPIESDQPIGEPDPRWEILKKLKNNEQSK